jgi:alpha-glucosidase
MTGPDLPDIRRDYMDLTGRPPVPPKKMFGMWISEWGFESWTEIDNKLATLRANKFPVDGFVLDAQWFGGIQGNTEASHMGALTWDTPFPNAASKIAAYKNNEGVGIMTIEESNIAKGQSAHADMANRGYLVRAGSATAAPVYMDQWWGKGGMIDWTLPAAGDYWHDLKRQKLINDGVMGHWTDLGEPETYDANDWTNGVIPGKHGHADYHNLYNLKWAESIVRGYQRNGVTRRPFILSRSGASGIQRFGAAMWSGDIGSRLPNLANHMNVQMHMSMSGIDYYGADIGGFFRSAIDSDEKELYTQWFANGMSFDIPGRPHAENLCNCHDTSPAATGNLASNLANVRRRYELVPYTYSLAYRAYLYGEPVVPPVFFYNGGDQNLREMGHEKMLGRDLLVGIVAGAGETQRSVYLPAGDWIDFHTNQWTHSTGQWLTNVPEYANGLFRLPMYARAGAIFPKMYVDDKTMNVFGKRTDGTTRNELIMRTYVSTTAANFTLYEDDGETTAYLSGATRTTLLSQQKTSASSETVTIAASSGTYTGAPGSRNNIVELVTENQSASGVTMNGVTLTQYATRAAFDAAASGWLNAGGNLILAKSGSQSVTTAKTFVFNLGSTPVVGVTFYQDANYGGAASGLKIKGDYAIMPSDVPNDWMSSLRVPAGWAVDAYSDGGFAGAVCTYTADTSWVGSACNDVMSSFRIR